MPLGYWVNLTLSRYFYLMVEKYRIQKHAERNSYESKTLKSLLCAFEITNFSYFILGKAMKRATFKVFTSFLKPLQSGKFGGASSDAQESQSQGIQSADDAAEHENMKAMLKTGLTDAESSTSTVPGLRNRTRGGSLRGRSESSVLLLLYNS